MESSEDFRAMIVVIVIISIIGLGYFLSIFADWRIKRLNTKKTPVRPLTSGEALRAVIGDSDESLPNRRGKLILETRWYRDIYYHLSITLLPLPQHGRFKRLLHLWSALDLARRVSTQKNFNHNPYLRKLFNDTVVALGKEINPDMELKELIELTPADEALFELDSGIKLI